MSQGKKGHKSLSESTEPQDQIAWLKRRHEEQVIVIQGSRLSDLEAAKLREAELTEELSACRESPGGCGHWRAAAKQREQERDAALSALEIARTALLYYEEFSYQKIAGKALAQIAAPSIALAERDRAQQLKGWQDAIDSVRGSLRGYPDCGGDIEIMREVERITSTKP